MPEQSYLTPEQLAESLQLNVRVVRRMLADGKLPGKKIGGVWRTAAEELRVFMESDNQKPVEPKAE